MTNRHQLVDFSKSFYFAPMLNRLIHLLRTTSPKDLPARLRRTFNHHVLGRPDFLQLQCISACNLRCEHCFLNDYGKTIPDGKIKILTLDEVKQRLQTLAPMVKKVGAVSFTSFESLLHKDFFAMMDAALVINPKLAFPLLTNGQLVTEEIVKRLEAYRIPTITISLDGALPETVEAFKTGAQYVKTLNAIRLFMASTLAEGVELVFVAHKNNIQELPEYMDLVAELGVRRVMVSNILTFRADLQGLALYGQGKDAEVQSIFDAAKEKARAFGITLGLPRLTPKAMGCQQAECLFVDIDGQVSPCDFLAVSTPFYFLGKMRTVSPVHFGNVLLQSPWAVWNSKDAKAFRKSHRLGKIPAPCSHCIDAYGMMCSHREFF